MTQPTLPWPDLSAYNLLLTVTHDKAGNRALVMRPSDPEEKSEKTSARVNALAPKIDQICQKIGNGQLKSTVWRSQYLVFTGPMVKNQALINRFFGRLFPKSSTIPLTLGQAESSEMVRQQAMKLFAKEKAGPNTALDDEELVQALPNGMDYARDDGVVVISTPNQPPVTINTASNITNEAARYFIEDALNQYLVTVNTDDIDLLRERLVNLNKSLKTDNLSYWSQVITECEVAFLDKEDTRLTKTDDLENQVSNLENQVGDLETQNTDLENQKDEPEKVDLYALRDTLLARLKNQGRVVDGRLVSKIKQLEEEIAKFEVELRVGEPERDNVQDNDTVVDEFGADGFRVIGQNTEGETLYENTDGVRSTISGDFRIHEPVTLVPTRAGMAKRPSARNNSWLIVEEALDAAPAGLSYEDMVRAAFATRVTKDDAHYWKPLSINHDGRSNQYLVRARERGAPKGELELITLNNAGANWMVTSERLSATNERILGALPYPAPKVLIGLWEDAGFYVADSEQQNAASTSNDDGSGANIENKQLNSEADHDNDSTQSEDTGTGTDTGEPGNLGGAGGLPGGSGAADGNAGSTTDDLLELGEQPGPPGQSEQPEQQPQLRSGEGRTEPTESVTGQNVDAESTSRRRAGGGAGVGGGSDGDTGAGAELPGATEPVSRQPGTGRDNGAVSGRDGGADTPVVSGADSGDLFSPGRTAAEETDGTDARPGTAGAPAADAATGNPGDSGTPDLDGLGQPVSTASGSESVVPEPGNANANPGSGADQDANERADSEPDWESFAESDTFDDFAQHERFYAGSDENPRGASARLRDNITAIMRLRELEDSGATPTMEDREVLAAYSGFGGIHAQLFARHTYGLPDWVNNANKTLMEMASDRTISGPEFSSMRTTILNAHYTHSGIIEPMWEALDRFNVPLARTLEPSSGTLQFKSFMPKALESKVSHMTGVEIDPLTARLAQAIHPDATVISSGFEKTSFPDNFFDCVISNVPFGDYNVFDPQNPLRKESIHNSFFLKGLDKVRPGGVVVGAGKTMQLIGSAIRGKQMGRWNKPLVVVPNHMLEQFTNDGHEIYPGAKILAMTAADARAVNRPTFAARCAMGDWDLVVCTHSVFEKVTIPIEVQARLISRELTKLRAGLEAERDGNDGKGKTPKDIEKAIVRLEESLERTMHDINDGNENILNLQQIGIDFIGVDEAHYYKNLMVDTSKQIPGISNASSKRAMNMLFKSQYMHDLHGGPYGVMMATGTPISNSVTECYTFTRMLRPDLLDGMGIKNFNDWMGLFGEIKHGMEIKPEGGGYHMKSRLSRFKNIPELIKMVRTFIDVKSREDLKLPTPDIVEQQIVAKPSPMMKDYMKYIEARARTVRAAKGDSKEAGQDIADLIRSTVYRANDKTVLDSETGEIDPDAVTEPTDDIMLTIATDGRKASLDLRMIHPKFDDHPGSKVNLCVKKCIEIYHQFDEHKAAQMLFCDFSSPTGKGIFNVYDDIKAKLVAAGIPEHEIAFIHDAKNDADKEKLFAKVRSGEVRFLLGSTQKMGVGTNVQERLIAMHQLDAPWKPSDVEQRLGRMDRQGNMFETAYNFTYLTEDSFDLFMWETLNRKLKMIRQAMQRPEDCARELDEETELGYEDILAVTTGNTAIKEFLETRVEMDKLKRMSDSHTDEQADLAARINQQEQRVEGIESLVARKVDEQKTVNNSLPLHIEFVGAERGLRDGPMCSAGGMAGLTEAIAAACERAQSYRDTTIGKFGGLELIVSRMAGEPSLQVMRSHGKAETVFRFISQQDLLVSKQDAAEAALIGGASKEPETPKDENREAAKALARYVNKIARDNDIEPSMETLRATKENLKNLRDDLGRPFEYEDKMIAVRKRFDELSVELGSEIDADKSIDPAPLISLAARIEEQTGDYAGLESRADDFASGRPKQAVRHDLDEDMAMLLDDDYDDQDDLTIG